jgi:acyl dehydratase
MSVQLFYDDITVGDSLPTLIKRPTPRQLVMWAGASGEFSEMHYDKEFALQKGFPGIIVHGMLTTSFLAQLITTWIGERGNLRKIKTRNEQFILVNEDIIWKGSVAKKYVENNEHYVECELWAENGKGQRYVSATVIVTLPTREASLVKPSK